MMHSLFGSVSYKCDKCKKPMEYEDIALRHEPRWAGDLLMKKQYCEKCAPVAIRTFLIKEAHE